MLGVVNKLLKTKSLLTTPSNVLPLHLKWTFPPIISIFTEGDGIKSRLSSSIFSTLFMKYNMEKNWKLTRILVKKQVHDFRIFSPQLRRGELHREQKLRIPFRNRLKKQDLYCIFHFLHMLAKLLVYFFKNQVPLLSKL